MGTREEKARVSEVIDKRVFRCLKADLRCQPIHPDQRMRISSFCGPILYKMGKRLEAVVSDVFVGLHVEFSIEKWMQRSGSGSSVLQKVEKRWHSMKLCGIVNAIPAAAE